MEEKLVKAVLFICPVCKYKIFIYFEELRESYNFNGNNFNALPKIDCHICHRSKAEAKEVKEVPDSWVDPLEIWLENPY